MTTQHIIPQGDIFSHDIESTCACNPSLRMFGSEMCIVHNAWDKREHLERAVDVITCCEEPDTNKSIAHYKEYLEGIFELHKDQFVTNEWLTQRVSSAFATMYETWQKKGIEIITE